MHPQPELILLWHFKETGRPLRGTRKEQYQQSLQDRRRIALRSEGRCERREEEEDRDEEVQRGERTHCHFPSETERRGQRL